MPRTPESNDRRNTQELSPEKRSEDRVNQIEKRVAPQVSVEMTKFRECEYEPELPGVKSTEWDLSRVQVIGDVHFIPGRDGKSLLIGSIMTVRGVDQWKRMSPESLSPSRVMAAKMVLGLKPNVADAPPTPRPTPDRRTDPIKTPDRRRESVATGSEKTPEQVLEALKNISISADGKDIPISMESRITTPSGLLSVLRKNDITAPRYPTYVKNMNDHARVLSEALRGKSPDSVSFDGLRFTVQDGPRTLVSTATRVLVVDAAGKRSTLDGERVNFDDKANSFEMTVNGRKEIHRKDGGIAVAEEGNTRQFFDGDNKQPIMEQRSGKQFIVGGGGDRVGMKPRGSLRNYSDAAAWGREIAQKLKTPEAIGAFISQFYHGQDYDMTSERTSWRNSQIRNEDSTVQYQTDRGGQDVKHWQRTLLERTGDCEDFALLAQGLLKEAGIKSFTMLVDPMHYETVYFESDGAGAYHVCTVGLQGFVRSTESYASLGDAAKSLWKSLGSGKSSGATFVTKGAPDGVVVLDQPAKPSDKKAESYTADYSEEEYFSQFVRK